jgi:tetratricopeptide (TPR) repeat protein
MLKYIAIAVLTLLVAGSWYKFHQAGQKAVDLKAEIEKLDYDPETADEAIAKKDREMKKKLSGMEGERIFTGILLTFLSAGLVGIVFATQILPLLANRVSEAVLASNEEVEPDPFHLARVLMAQGEWEGAIEAFKAGAEKNPGDRMPWVEIARIQRQNLENPSAALATLRQAIESNDWEQDDVAFLMFRLVEIYEEDFQDHNNASAVLTQVMELFPETRHSANARTKLHQMGMV